MRGLACGVEAVMDKLDKIQLAVNVFGLVCCLAALAYVWSLKPF